jgi:hypothetical protein
MVPSHPAPPAITIPSSTPQPTSTTPSNSAALPPATPYPASALPPTSAPPTVDAPPPAPVLSAFYHYYPGAHTTYFSTHDKPCAQLTSLFKLPKLNQHLVSPAPPPNVKTYTTLQNPAVYNPIGQIFGDKGSYKFEHMGYSSDATVVVDGGHTGTRVICVWRGKTIAEKNIAIGGERMTKELRDRISYR